MVISPQTPQKRHAKHIYAPKMFQIGSKRDHATPEGPREKSGGAKEQTQGHPSSPQDFSTSSFGAPGTVLGALPASIIGAARSREDNYPGVFLEEMTIFKQQLC